MTEREMRIMEDHTRALNANTRTMERIIPLLEVMASKKFLDYISSAADTNLTAARRMESAASDFMSVLKKMEEVAESNNTAANRMLEAAEINRNNS